MMATRKIEIEVRHGFNEGDTTRIECACGEDIPMEFSPGCTVRPVCECGRAWIVYFYPTAIDGTKRLASISEDN